MAVRLNPYLVMNGNAKEAVPFYEKALGAKLIAMMTFGEMPASPDFKMPEEMKSLIMHAHLKVGDFDLMFSDTMPNMPHQSGNQVSIALHCSSKEEAERYFAGLAEGGKVEMPLQATDWSPAYGQLTDKFGVPWQINTEAKR